MKNAYKELEDRFKRMDALNGALSMLYWDMSAMMPVLLGMLGLGAMRTVEKTQKGRREK